MVPIEHSRERKHVVLRAWIRSITNECIYPGFVEGEPGGVEVGDDGSSVDEIAIVEMVVVVVCVTEVLAGITCDVAPRGDNAIPDCIIHQWVYLLIGRKYSKGSFQFIQSLGREVGFVQQVVSRVDNHCELG